MIKHHARELATSKIALAIPADGLSRVHAAARDVLTFD